MPLDSLKIEDFSDREFLLIVADVITESGEGWADSDEVARRMDLASRRLASSRLAWLRRYGAVEREHVRDEHGNIRYHRNGKPMHTQRWRLTSVGEAVAFGKLRKKDETALGSMGDEQMLLVTRWLTERTAGDESMGKLVSREWRYGHAKGRR
jgi:hypothetical protein